MSDELKDPRRAPVPIPCSLLLPSAHTAPAGALHSLCGQGCWAGGSPRVQEGPSQPAAPESTQQRGEQSVMRAQFLLPRLKETELAKEHLENPREGP